MARIPDLRTTDPARPGIGAETVALPDLIENIKAFNEAWSAFEKDLDTARLKEVISICSSGEMLYKCLRMRVIGVRSDMRVEKLSTLERKLEEAQAKKAALMAHTLKEESALWAGIRMAEAEEWVNKRIATLQKRIQNRRSWPEQKAKKYAKAS